MNTQPAHHHADETTTNSASTERFKLIAIPSRTRSSFEFVIRWDEIQSADQLPSRLFNGDLDKNSFKLTPAGWEAKYVGGPFSVTAERKDGWIWLSEHFLTHSLQTLCFAGKLRSWEFLKCAPWHANGYDQHLKEYYESRYNLCYYPIQPQNKFKTVIYVPDGAVQVLLVPIPMRDESLAGLISAMRDLQQKDNIAVNGYLRFDQAWVNYREGLCPNVPQSLLEHFMWVMQQGYIPMQLAAWEGTATDRALTSYRCSYALVLPFFMRDGPEILDCLAAHEVILPHTNNGDERLASIMHLQDMLVCQKVSAFTKDGSRRVGLLTANDCGQVSKKQSAANSNLSEFESAMQLAYRGFQMTVQELHDKLQIK